MAIYVGHDHKNNFIGTYKNVDLGFTPSSGFNAYGNRTKRGVRCFILDEKEPDSYKTYSRTYEDLVGKKCQDLFLIIFPAKLRLRSMPPYP